MQRWTLPVSALFVAFLALTAWLSYQVAVRFLETNGMQLFRNAFNEENYPPSPAEVDELLNEIETSNTDVSDPNQGYFYIDLLARRAWNHPESSRDDLHEAIRASQEMYRDYDYFRPYLVRWMIYLYAAAGLPSKVELWQTEAIARDPASLEYVRYFQIAALLSRDDFAGARALLEDELGSDEPRPTAAGLAIAGYSILGDQERAAEYEQYIDKYGFIDDYFKHMYASHLIESGRYADARVVLDELGIKPENDPDDARRLALILAGLNGIDDSKTTAMIDLAILTTRRQISRDGFIAELLADLYRIEEDPAYLVRLLELAGQQPDNALISYYVAMSAANCWEFHREDLMPVEGSWSMPTDLTDEESLLLSRPPADWARDAYELANSDYEIINSGLLLATVLAWPDGLPGVSGDNLREAVEVLGRVMGDPGVENTLATQRLIDYELFLIDEQVNNARSAFPWFDSAVNHVVIDYLNRQREHFKDIVSLEPLSYRDDLVAGPEENTLPVASDAAGMTFDE